MSWRVSQWAVGQEAGTAGAKAVLMILAEAASMRDASCFLSHLTIARRAKMSETSVWTHLRRLEACGLIRRERRHDGWGRRASDLIVLNLPAEAGDAPSPPAAPMPAPPANVIPLGAVTVRDADAPAAYSPPAAGRRLNSLLNPRQWWEPRSFPPRLSRNGKLAGLRPPPRKVMP